MRIAVRHSSRGGVLLDGVVALGIVLLGAFALSAAGLTFIEIVNGAARFFGV